MQNTTHFPMTLRWFRDSIATVYVWDHQDRYFYMFIEGVDHPRWIALSHARMHAIQINLEEEELRREDEAAAEPSFAQLQDIARNS